MAGPRNGRPTVALVIPTHNGARHLPACLQSIAALDYPADRIEVIVVDNASTDGSGDIVRELHSRARLMRLERNVGFAAAVNAAAAASESECLALANDDMRLDQRWLDELARRYDGTSSPCVGGVILDWTGEHVQFAGGIVNFHGAAAQVPFGDRVGAARIAHGSDLPFACGGSMLIDRRLFLDLGGFDEDYFAYFEDVDLGWRLRLAGHSIQLAAGSRCFHRHHATGGTFPLERRLRLYEANWLRTLLKNVADENLPRLLAAALLLVPERARAEVDASTARARVAAIADVTETMPSILARRRAVQARRRRTDAEVFALFGRPFFPAIDHPEYLDSVERVIHALRLEELFPEGDRFAVERERLGKLRGTLPRRAARRLRRFAAGA